jgi:hypothetical protein
MRSILRDVSEFVVAVFRRRGVLVTGGSRLLYVAFYTQLWRMSRTDFATTFFSV